MQTVSYGGGVQSTSLLVLAAQREIDFDTFLFSNVGNDSENPATISYVRNIAMPFAEHYGIKIHELYKTRFGEPETLYGRITRPGSLAMPVPARLSSGAPARRTCTVDFKLQVTGKWLKDHGATPEHKATVAIGISVDEIQRANPNKAQPWETLVYPLLDLGLRREDCIEIIADAGLPVPPKSSCWFCPFHSLPAWRDLAINNPSLFASACALEGFMSERSQQRGHGPVWLFRKDKPLREITEGIDPALLTPDEPLGCDDQYCWI